MELWEHRAKPLSLKASEPMCNSRGCKQVADEAGVWRQHGVVGNGLGGIAHCGQ